MENKRIIDMTADELFNYLSFKEQEKLNKQNGVSTKQLAKELGVCDATIGVYGRAGMYDEPKCRIATNRWDVDECRTWIMTVYKNKCNKRKRNKLDIE